ncbi:exported hypothetical protein [Streptomyces misionensis JCM 4497]
MYAAFTTAALAVPVSRSAPPPTTAAATRPPIALFLPLILRRCVLIRLPAFVLTGFRTGGAVRQHASDPESGKRPDRDGGSRS